jgi:hypothetical protein
MTTRRHHRPGVTLTEVLVALFVMAVGMIALLVMFPLGAQQIAQAIKDERSAQAANNADTLLRDHWRQNVVEVIRAGVPESRLVNPGDPFHVDYMTAMEQPNNPLLAPDRSAVLPALSDPTTFRTYDSENSHASYPVFVDPYGDVTRTSVFPASRRWVAGVHQNAGNTATNVSTAIPRMPRRTLNFPQTGASMGTGWPYRYATLQDDLDFGEDGNANHLGTGVTKTGRYNWAWVLQRPTQGNRLITNMTVLVYDQRAYNFARPEDEIAYPFSLTIPPVGGLVNPTQVTIFYDVNADLPIPSVRPGQWVMDGTITTMTAAPNLGLTVRSANFYRVTAVTETPTNATSGSVTLDLQTPMKVAPGFTQDATNAIGYPRPLPANPALNPQGLGQLYILRGVAEVFERRPLTTDDTPVVR